MGARGPVPKRSAQRRRRNKQAAPEKVQPVTPPSGRPDAAELADGHTKAQLLELAATAGVEVSKGLRKAEIAAAIVEATDHQASDERWHPVAKRWFDSLAESAQSKFYEPSDWALAFIIAESISRDLKPQVVGVHPETGELLFAVIPMKGASLSAYLKAMTALIVSEGDRRRAGLEIEQPPPANAAGGGDDAEVVSLDAIRARAAG